MSKINVLDMAGKVVGEIELNDSVFGIEPNTAVMHADVKNYLANQRHGTQSTLTRAEVSGGGRKQFFHIFFFDTNSRIFNSKVKNNLLSFYPSIYMQGNTTF